MARHDPAAGDDRGATDVDAAVARVLAAERAAADAVESARRRAAQGAELARADARRIEARARERIARAHARVEARLQAALAALQAEMQALPAHDEPDADDRARLAAAVQRLAADLTGGGLARSRSRLASPPGRTA